MQKNVQFSANKQTFYGPRNGENPFVVLKNTPKDEATPPFFWWILDHYYLFILDFGVVHEF